MLGKAEARESAAEVAVLSLGIVIIIVFTLFLSAESLYKDTPLIRTACAVLIVYILNVNK